MPISLFPSRSFRDSSSERVNDLVVFYTYLYNFWYYKGKWNAVLHRFTDFANCVILTALVFVFSLMFDWEVALTCEGEKCANAKLIHSPRLPSEHYILAWVFLCSTIMVSLWELRVLVESYWLYGEVHQYVKGHVVVGYETPFHSYLYQFRKWKYSRAGHSLLEDDCLSQRWNHGTGTVRPPLLEDMDWDTFLHTVVHSCLRKDKGINGYKTMDELKVVQVMLMMPNYQTALHHHGILNQAPLCYADHNTVKMLIEASMAGYRVKDVESARKSTKDKLFLWTLALFLLYPFIVSFMLTKLLVKTVAEMKNSPESAIQRGWSATALWRFRLYNEVSHSHQARLQEGNEKAVKIISRTNAALEHPIARIAQRTAACVILIIVVASWINTPLLNFGFLFGRTLIWWLSTALVVFGVATGFSKQESREYDHSDDLSALVKDLHYARPCWFSSAASFVRDIEVELLPRRIYTTLIGFLFVVFSPAIYLWIYKSPALEKFLDFIQRHHSEVSGIGSLCTPSTFHLKEGILLRTRGPRGEGVEGDEESDDEHLEGGENTEDTAVVEMEEKSNEDDGNSPCPAVVEGEKEIDALMGAGTRGQKKNHQIPFDQTKRQPGTPLPKRGRGSTADLKSLQTRNPFGTSYELKIEKSIVSFAAIYPLWLEEYTTHSEAHAGTELVDPLGIDLFLATISQKHTAATLEAHGYGVKEAVAAAAAAAGKGNTYDLGDEGTAIDSIALHHVEAAGELIGGVSAVYGGPSAGHPHQASCRPLVDATLESVLRTPRDGIPSSTMLRHPGGALAESINVVASSQQLGLSRRPLDHVAPTAGGSGGAMSPRFTGVRGGCNNTAHGRQAATVGLLDDLHTNYNLRYNEATPGEGPTGQSSRQQQQQQHTSPRGTPSPSVSVSASQRSELPSSGYGGL